MKIIQGNLLEAKSGFIVHGCNTEGHMGAGVALSIRKQFPVAYEIYQKNKRELGMITIVPVTNELYIINAITQTLDPKRKRNVSYDAITVCFERINKAAKTLSPDSINFPLIGAGLGGGSWRIIERIIEETLTHPVEKNLYVLDPAELVKIYADGKPIDLGVR